jgi:hypothetical protein
MYRAATLLLVAGAMLLVVGEHSNLAAPDVSPAALSNNYFDALKANIQTKKMVQNRCIAHGQTCVINGTACCSSRDTCSGNFPNTYCQ